MIFLIGGLILTLILTLLFRLIGLARYVWYAIMIMWLIVIIYSFLTGTGGFA